MKKRLPPFLLALILSLLTLSCYEKIELDNSDNFAPAIQLKSNVQPDSSFVVEWTQTRTSKFVRYVLVSSTAPISADITLPIADVSLKIERTITDPAEYSTAIRFGFTQSNAVYFRVIVELTDRQLVSNEVVAYPRNGVVFPFRLGKILSSPNFDRLWVWSDSSDSIYLVDTQQKTILASNSIFGAVHAMCYGKYQNHDVLFLRTSNKMYRLNGNTLEKEVETATVQNTSSMIFIKDELVCFIPNSTPKQIKVLDADDLLPLSTYNYSTSQTSGGNEPMYCNNPDTKEFTCFTTSTGSRFRIKSDNSIEMLKTQPHFTGTTTIPKLSDFIGLNRLMSGSSAFWDEDLDTQTAIDLPPNSNALWSTYAEDKENFILATRTFTNSSIDVQVHKRSFATQADLVQPLKVDVFSSSQDYFFEYGGKLYWAGNDGLSNFNLASSKF